MENDSKKSNLMFLRFDKPNGLNGRILYRTNKILGYFSTLNNLVLINGMENIIDLPLLVMHTNFQTTSIEHEHKQ